MGISGADRILAFNMSVPFSVLTGRRYARDTLLDRTYATFNANRNRDGDNSWQTGVGGTQPVAFSLKLEGCPPGSASITFSGTPAPGTALLALADTAMAQKLAIEIRDGDQRRLPLEQASKAVDIDNNGNATLKFYANYIALADGVQPGLANADATFLINYN